MASVADSATRSSDRQQCIDVLCGYLRLPFDPESGKDHRSEYVRKISHEAYSVKTEESDYFRLRYYDREVRKAITRVMAQRLRGDSEISWSSNVFDFTSAYLEDLEFYEVKFNSTAWFTRATFAGESCWFYGSEFHGRTRFDGAIFKCRTVNFNDAVFDGPVMNFSGCHFKGDSLSFTKALFECKNPEIDRNIRKSVDKANFEGAVFKSRRTDFAESVFIGMPAMFSGAEFRGEHIRFDDAKFRRGAYFNDCEFEARTSFWGTEFQGDWCYFRRAQFSGVGTDFWRAKFSASEVSFEDTHFDGQLTSFNDSVFSGGSVVRFHEAKFGGERLNFSKVHFIDGVVVEFGSGQYQGASRFECLHNVDFVGAEFDGEKVSFQGAVFHTPSVMLYSPKKWGNVTFDWTEDDLPEYVFPKSWPPKVEVDVEDGDVDG